MGDWCEFAVRNPAPSSLWLTFTGDGPMKGLLHSTESDGFTPRRDSYFGHTSYPHFTVFGTTVYQHIPVSRAARALKNLAGGVQTNTDTVIQVEVVARAAQPQWHELLVQTVARLMRWVEASTGVKPRTFDFFHDYPPEDGHRLGREPWRMSQSQWDRFDGWCGHQHAPENAHGDPGRIPIHRLLDIPGGVLVPLRYVDSQLLPDALAPWPNGRWTFIAVTEDGKVDVLNDVSALTGPSQIHRGDLKTLGVSLEPGHKVIGLKILVQNERGDVVPWDSIPPTTDRRWRYHGYLLLAEDGGTFKLPVS